MPWISRVEADSARSDRIVLQLSPVPFQPVPGQQGLAPTEDSQTITVHLDDAIGLTEGMELSQDRVEALQSSIPTRDCRAKALSLLARRDHAHGELETKLQQRHFQPAIIRTVCDELLHNGLLDDQRFVAAWIAGHRSRRPRGLRFLSAECAERGVSRSDFSTAERALLAEEPDFEATECRAALEKLRKTQPNSDRRLQTLLRWGFRHATIRSVENSSARTTR